ncbi:MAG: cupin domain-containing protein [Candidatus Dadabacteria bacterium]|nr:MAG: cupin domain-containing protein [Candidatus Dadabacteria bacterium]
MKILSVAQCAVGRKNPVASGPHSRVTVWRLEPGDEIHPHVHKGDHVWVVTAGEGSFLTPDGAHAVEAGTVVFVPEGEAHGMRAGREPLVFVSVSAGGE